MFRKEEALAKDWSPEKSENLSQIQKELILTAWDMLRPGGMLLYSTCTFAPCEDEEVISCLLSQHPEAEVVPLPDHEGFSPGVPAWGKGEEALSRCVRIFPHKMKGEGHFMALLRKPGILLSNHQFPAGRRPRIHENGWKYSFRKSDLPLLEGSRLTGAG